MQTPNVPPTRDQIQATLEAAAEAHHEYEKHALDGKRDEQWAGWYAAYLMGRLGDIAPASRLAQWLDSAETGGVWAYNAAVKILEEVGDSAI